MYMLKTVKDGVISVIENLDKGNVFDPNPALPEYQEMLKWLQANLSPPLNLAEPLPDETMIFLNRHALAEHCRRRGILLHATTTEVFPFGWTHITLECGFAISP